MSMTHTGGRAPVASLMSHVATSASAVRFKSRLMIRLGKATIWPRRRRYPTTQAPAAHASARRIRGWNSHAATRSPRTRAAAARVSPQPGQATPVTSANGQMVGPPWAGNAARPATARTGRVSQRAVLVWAVRGRAKSGVADPLQEGQSPSDGDQADEGDDR